MLLQEEGFGYVFTSSIAVDEKKRRLEEQHGWYREGRISGSKVETTQRGRPVKTKQKGSGVTSAFRKSR